jgi:hypothetical protein
VKLASFAGLIAAVGLGLVYGGLMYVGATAGTQFPATTERTTLLVGITQVLLGGGAKLALGLAVALACLTTSIGLTATVGDYFSQLSKGRVGYRAICVATVVFSGVFATVGVTTIVNVAVPLLVTVYPVAIVLILLTMAEPLVTNRLVYVGAVIGALATSVPQSCFQSSHARSRSDRTVPARRIRVDQRDLARGDDSFNEALIRRLTSQWAQAGPPAALRSTGLAGNRPADPASRRVCHCAGRQESAARADARPPASRDRLRNRVRLRPAAGNAGPRRSSSPGGRARARSPSGSV